MPCKENYIAPCNKQKKFGCNKSLFHIKEVFEFTALLFANISNLSKNLLYIKLNLEKFGKILGSLKELILTKLQYYKTSNNDLKAKTTNSRLFKLIRRLKSLEEVLTEESNKLQTYINLLPSQIQLSLFTCIPLYHFSNIIKTKTPERLSQIHSQVQYVLKFIKLLLKTKQSPHKSTKFIRTESTHSFIFQIFHIRSLFLKKLQPYTNSLHLTKNCACLLGYMTELPNLKLQISKLKLMSINIVQGDSKVRPSLSLSKNIIHSYNSSWDLSTEDYMCVAEAYEEDELSSDDSSLSSENRKENFEFLKNSKILSQTPDLSGVPSMRSTRRTENYTPENNGFTPDNKLQRFPSVNLTSSQFNRTYTTVVSEDENKKSQNYSKQIKKLKNENTGFLNHRIRRIQNNKSISPLTKIDYIREEFSNQLRPLETQLKNSFLKLKNKNTYLFTLR